MTIALDEKMVAGVPSRTKAIVAGSVGNILEWYDFAIYAFFVPTLSVLFFPAKTEIMSILIAFAAFGAGFVTRPLGAVLFGMYADRAGRRASLSVVSILMGGATLAIGLMPTFESIGVWAAVGIVCARLIQGLSAGGEYGGAIPFLVEFAPPNRRGFIGSWQQSGNAIGLLIGSLFAFFLTTFLTPDDLKNWGWRIPFIAGVLPAIAGWYLRFRSPETPVFERLKAKTKTASSTLKATFVDNLRETATVFGIVIHLSAGFYIFAIFMPTYLGLVSKIDRSQSLLIVSIGLLTYSIACLFAGYLSDKWGRRPLMLLSAGGSAVLLYPLFLMAASGRFELAVIAEIVLAGLLALAGGPIAAIAAEAAPAKSRATIVAVGIAFSISIFGGFAPFVSTYLIATFHTPSAPAFYAMGAALITFVVALRMRETAFRSSID